MKNLAILIFLCSFIACSSDDGGASTNGQVNSADDVMGSWRVIERYESGSSVNSATPCNLQLSTVFFGENHLFTMKTGNTTDTGTCSTTTSTFDEFYILPGIVRIEKNSYTKIVFDAQIVNGDLQLTETGYQNSGGYHSVEEADQVTYVYEKQ